MILSPQASQRIDIVLRNGHDPHFMLHIIHLGRGCGDLFVDRNLFMGNNNKTTQNLDGRKRSFTLTGIDKPKITAESHTARLGGTRFKFVIEALSTRKRD